MKDTLTSYLFLLPFLLIFLVFLAFPVFYAFYLSMHEVRDLADVFGGMEWVGLKNYLKLMHDARFWWSFLITLYYAALSIPLGILVSFTLAVILNQPLKFRNAYRSAIFLPYILDVFVVGIVWTFLYSYPYGVITRLLMKIGIKIPGLLSTPGTALPSVVVAMVLKNCGFGMVLFLASLQNIPRSLYEACEVDGGGVWEKVRFVTIPLLKPLFLFMVIIGIIGAFSAFAEFYAMTGGGPAVIIGNKTFLSTEVTGLYLYRNFEQLKLGYAASISYTLLFINLAFSYLASLSMRRRFV